MNKFSDMTDEEFENKYLMKPDVFNRNAPSQVEISEKVTEKGKDKNETFILEKPVPAGYFDALELGTTFLKSLYEMINSLWYKNKKEPVVEKPVEENPTE